MDEDKELEDKITTLMAETFKFVPVKNKLEQIMGYKCQYCSKRFFITYYGIGINERMIQHAKQHGIG